MNSVPTGRRGVASGMRSTFQNSGTALSIGVFFSLMIAGLAGRLPGTLAAGLRSQGVPSGAAEHAAGLPPVSTLFAAFLGDNPIGHLLGPLAGTLPTGNVLTGTGFFPRLISAPFHHGLYVVFTTAAVMAAVAATASLLRGASSLTTNPQRRGDMSNDALTAGTTAITGQNGDEIEAYLARPTERSGYGGVVVIHHMPGYDEATKEIVRKFAANGYAALCPNLYSRQAPGASPDDAAAAVRAAGGVADEQLVGDVDGAARHLRSLDGANGKIGVIGYCSGGRQSFLAACSLDLDAAVDCYGAFVVNEPPSSMPASMKPILGLAPQLSCPLLGLFGAEDGYPGPEETAKLSAERDRLGKEHEFHTYEGAGHAFFSVDRPSYRQEAAVDGWGKVFDFFGHHLSA
jgi:carboxymethylenebutenolidase